MQELPVIFAPRAVFEQIFQNLLSNSIKHNDKNKIQIKLQFKQDLESFEFILFDNGPGILEKFHSKVFEIFQTLQSKDKVEGSGVGLAIVKRLVEKNHGEVWISSTRAQGCSFHLKWPSTAFNITSKDFVPSMTV